MKDYHLRVPDKDTAPTFVQKLTERAKASNEITGLIRGILADGIVSESEADCLKRWIGERPELLRADSVVAALADRIMRIYEDGIVTPDELTELKRVLLEFSPDNNFSPTTLPLDRPQPEIIFLNQAFCITGTFISGKRSWCEDQIQVRGGEVHNGINSNTSFLVIGTKVSGAWVSQTYGRKIQAAVEARQSGSKIAIVNEEHWLRYLK